LDLISASARASASSLLLVPKVRTKPVTGPDVLMILMGSASSPECCKASQISFPKSFAYFVIV
jgi:hypothetical protein